MRFCHVKCLLVAAFSFFSCLVFAQGEPGASAKTEKESFDADEVIFGHVLDAHEFHFFSYQGKNGKEHAAVISLPVILYSPQRGFSIFMSSRFDEGKKTYRGYELLTKEKIEGLGLDPQAYNAGQIVAVNERGGIESGTKVYDFSLTRNVVQMLIALGLLVWVMLSIAKKYKQGEGVNSAPKGTQSLLEPVINFIKDEVAKPNLGDKYQKYLPYLLTVFFSF